MYRTEFTSQPWKVQIRIHPGRPTALARVWTNLFWLPGPEPHLASLAYARGRYRRYPNRPLSGFLMGQTAGVDSDGVFRKAGHPAHEPS